MKEFVKKSAVLQMLHEAYADGVIDTKDGCKALYKRLNELPDTTVKHGEWVERAYGRKQCTCCGKCEDVATDICPNCNAIMRNPEAMENFKE